MDLLSAFFDTIHLRTSADSRNEYSAPWGVRVPASTDAVPAHARVPAVAWPVGRTGRKVPLAAPRVSFCAFTQGDCWIQLNGAGPPTNLLSGDVIVLTQGRAFTLLDSRRSGSPEGSPSRSDHAASSRIRMASFENSDGVLSADVGTAAICTPERFNSALFTGPA